MARRRPPCGTRNGYVAHRRRDERACWACRVAAAAYMQQRRALRAAAEAEGGAS